MLTIEAAAQALRAGELSSVELLRETIARADRLDAKLGSYLLRFDETARVAAERADGDFARGVDRGPLQGIPVIVKDNLFTVDGPTSGQSLVRLAGYDDAKPASVDATAVARLRAAGAVIAGKATLSEFAIGAPDLTSPYPRPRNPWDLHCWPGGSSSGSGVAVAAGLALAGLGTDSAGSIRMPSAMCGVTGLKPTFGLVPVTGSIPLAPSLDHVGPIARSAWDCAAVLQAIAGHDPADPSSLPGAASPLIEMLKRPLPPIRLGVAPAPDSLSDSAFAAVFQDAIEVLRALTGQVAEVELPAYAASTAAAKVILEVESYGLHRASLSAHWSNYSRSTRIRVATGAFSTAADLLLAQRQRTETLTRLRALFDTVDVVATTVFTVGAPRYGPDEIIDRTAIGDQASAVRYWSPTGYPALVMPIGSDANGLPLSLQLVARPGHDGLLLRLAAAFQQITEWHLREPALRNFDSAHSWDVAAVAREPLAPESADVELADMLLHRDGIEARGDLSELGLALATHRAEARTLTDAGPSAVTAAAERVTVRGLGAYVLPGAAPDPRLGLREARAAEDLGLDAVWIGERFDSKDLPTLAAAIAQVTNRVRIGAAVTVPYLRHPMVLASMGQTLQSLSGERFRLGFGRSAAWRWRAYGAPHPTLQALGDLADVLRRLWAGETVDYTGPLGRFPMLRLPVRLDLAPPPLLLAAVGPRTVELAGRHFDGVILHPLLTPDAVARSTARMRAAAEAAGRDPDGLRCIATVLTAVEVAPEDEDEAIRARAAGYLSVPGLGDAIARANDWDEGELARYRAQPALVGLGQLPADKHLSRPQLIELAATLPSGWLAAGAITGDAQTGAARLHEYTAAGADEVILHGTVGDALAPLVRHLAGRGAHLT